MDATFPETRWSLIRRLDAQGGDTAVVLVACYADAVARYVRARLAGNAHVDDIVQAVLQHLLERPDILAQATPQPGSKFRYLLMRVAWNEARNAMRRFRPAHGSAETLSVLVHTPDETQGMDRAWAASVLAQVWNEMRQRAAAGLIDAQVLAITEAHLIRGESLRSLAEHCQLSLATCSRRLAQGRMLLQQALVERLQVAGEWSVQDTPGQACDRLLQALS